jgi:hypothetical protein
VLALGLATLAAAGCESTQQKSARLARGARAGARERGVVVRVQNPLVRVLATGVVSDRYGTAAYVRVRSRARRDQALLPLNFAIEDARGKAVFANTVPGLAPSLTHVPLLRAGEEAWWVDDQVTARGAGRVHAKVGSSSVAVRGSPPKLAPGGLTLQRDPSGAYTRGALRNLSGVEQRNLIVYAVALKHGRVVAAGRAGIQRLKAHGRAVFKVFWIGDARGARVRVFAPPTVLREGS